MGFRRQKNLADHLVRAKCEPTKERRGFPTFRDNKTGKLKFRTQRCRFRNCIYCPLFDRTGTIRSVRTREKFRTRTKITCLSNNLIYALECRRCGKQYVGQTGDTIRSRLSGHFSDIRCQKLDKPVGRHFSAKNRHNGGTDIKIHILEFLQTPPTDEFVKHREAAERKWQDRLRTSYPWGINWEDAIPGFGKPGAPQPR